MTNILENIKKNLHNLISLRFNKIIVLFFLMIFFSLIYMLLDDNNFEGINKFKEIIKEEVIKDKVKQEISENFTNIKKTKLDKMYSTPIIEEKIIDKATQEVEKETKTEELDPANVEPSLFKKYLNRLYFAIITGCLLGYGDIYPVSDVAKFLSGIQGLLTVSLIIY